jgi:hypothetical protein
MTWRFLHLVKILAGVNVVDYLTVELGLRHSKIDPQFQF